MAYDQDAYDANYGLSAAQYHDGVAKLWKALKATGPQDVDVFTQAAEMIESQRAEIEVLKDFISEADERLERQLEDAGLEIVAKESPNA